ncbi:MAG TPA: hypothetical protein PKH02_07340 [Bacteroidales bacterium]|nr:hypothetical protein [Bacteroidales bacterium]
MEILGRDNYRMIDTATIDPQGSWTYKYGGGYSRRDKSTDNSTELTFYTNYSKKFEAIAGRIDLILGYFSLKRSYTLSVFETNLASPVVLIYNTKWDGENNQTSFFGRLKYSMYDRYEFDFTLRPAIRQDRFISTNRFTTPQANHWKGYISIRMKVVQLIQ